MFRFGQLLAYTGGMPLSKTAARTRRDIVDAAVRCWGRDSAATLTEIAQEAGVGRTTLNRYFPSRETLIDEVATLARRRMVDAFRSADLAAGLGCEALLRAAANLLDIPEVLALVFTDDPVVDPDAWEHEGAADPVSVRAAIERGHADGSIDSNLSVDWVETFLWTTLLAAQLMTAAGQPAHRVGRWLERSLAGGISGSGSPAGPH